MKSLQPFCLALFALCGAPLANAANSSAGAGEIAIYTEATGGDLLTTADFTHDFDTNDREDVATFSRAGADITLNRAGHYLAIYNSRFDANAETGAEQRVEIQSHLRLNATDLPSGWSQGFIRRQQNQRETITSGMAVIEAAAADVLQLHSFRTDTTTFGTTTRIANATGLQLIKLDDVNMGYARLSLAANQTGPVNATFVKVAYDTNDELGAGFAHGTAGNLTLTDGGKYLVIANTYGRGATNRTSLVQRLTLGGTPVANSTTTVYTRGNNQSTQEGTAAIGMILEATAGQVLSVECSLDVNQTLNYVGGQCALTVVKLPSAAAGTVATDPEYIRIRHTADQNINAGPDTALIFNTQDEVDAAFAHAVSTSAVTVNTDGDYLFLSSVFDATDDIARAFYNQGWSVNGLAREAVGQSGRYSRSTGGADQFGNTSGFIGSSLVATNTVEMVSSALGNGGVNNANRIALQGVRLASLFTESAFGVDTDSSLVAVTEGGATDSYELSLRENPAAGTVDVTVTSDADTEVSLNGTTFTPTVIASFTDTTPQTIHVRAFDDGDVEGPETATLTHAITASGDLTNYPLGMAIADVLADVTDDDIIPVDAIDDVSEVGNPADEDNALSVVDNGGGGTNTSLLDNDTDGSGNVVSAFDATSTMGAAVSVAADGTFTWDPTGSAALQALDDGDQVTDTFTYTALDLNTNTDTATVSITVDGVNDDPAVVDDAATGTDSSSTSLNLLANDSDVDSGDVLTVVSINGTPVGLTGATILSGEEATVTVMPDGSFTYDPSTSFDIGFLDNGDTSFEVIPYEVSDGTATVAGSVTITSVGTAGASNDAGLVAAGGTTNLIVLDNDDIFGAPATPTAGALADFNAADPGNTDTTWINNGTAAGGVDMTMESPGVGSVLNTSLVGAPVGVTAAYDLSGTGSGSPLEDADNTNSIYGSNISTTDLTLEMVFRPDDLVGDEPLWGSGGNGTGSSLVLLDDQLIFTAGQGATVLQVLGTLPTSEYVHVIVTVDLAADTAELFINNVLADTSTAINITTGAAADITDWSGTDNEGLGRSNGTTGGDVNVAPFLGAFGTTDIPDFNEANDRFDGEIAILRIYSGPVLDAAARTANFEATFGVATAAATGDIIEIAGETTLAPLPVTVPLPSGALVTFEADGTFTYDPNGAFDHVATGLTENDTFEYTLDSTAAASATVTVRVTGTNPNTQVTISGPAGSVTEGNPAAFTIDAASNVTGDVTVNLSYTGTATDGSDYTSQASVVIADGTNSIPVNLTTIADLLFEGGSETIIVTIDSITGPATVGALNAAGATLDDADSAPVFTLSTPAGNTIEGGAVTFGVAASVASSVDISLDLAYTGDADASDFSPQISVTVPAAQTAAPVNLLAFDDGTAEGNESLTATISNPTLGSIGAPDNATATIEDGAGELVFFADFEGVDPLDTPGGTVLNTDAPAAANLGTDIGTWANVLTAASGGNAPGLVAETDDARGDGLDTLLRQDRPFDTADGALCAVFDGAIDISTGNTGTISFDVGQLRTLTTDKNTHIIGLDDAGTKSFEFVINGDNANPSGKSLYHADSAGTLTQLSTFNSLPNTQDFGGGGNTEAAHTNIRLGLSPTGYTIALDVPGIDGVPDVITGELDYAGGATVITKILFQIAGSTDVNFNGGLLFDNVSAAGTKITATEAWRIAYFGSPANSGDGADNNDFNGNGLVNLLDYAFGIDPVTPTPVSDLLIDGAGNITQFGGPTVWVDPADGRVYLRYPRRADYAAIPLDFDEDFTRDLATWELNVDPLGVIGTGLNGGVSVEAVQVEFPSVLPVSGGKARDARVRVTP